LWGKKEEERGDSGKGNAKFAEASNQTRSKDVLSSLSLRLSLSLSLSLPFVEKLFSLGRGEASSGTTGATPVFRTAISGGASNSQRTVVFVGGGGGGGGAGGGAVAMGETAATAAATLVASAREAGTGKLPSR